MAGAHPHPSGGREESRLAGAAPRSAHPLPRHQGAELQAAGRRPQTLPGAYSQRVQLPAEPVGLAHLSGGDRGEQLSISCTVHGVPKYYLHIGCSACQT